MNIPDNLYYTKDHEWIKYESKYAIIGVTDYAQKELGDIIFIELPYIGKSCLSGESIGIIEAVKTVADIYAPIDGKVKEVNNILMDKPESINKDPYNSGWIVKLSNINKDDIKLFSASEYKGMIQ